MDTLLESLEQYIITAGYATTDGIDIFRDYIPDQPDKAVFLIEYDATPLNPVPSDTADRFVQVSVRDVQPTSCKLLCHEIYKILVSDGGFVDLPNARWSFISPRQAPIKITEDSSERVIYGFNIIVTTNID